MSVLGYSQSVPNKEALKYLDLATEKQFSKTLDLDSVIICFNIADSISPNNALVLHERGLFKCNMGNYNEGIIDINKSIELTTDDKKKEIRYCNRGLVHMENKRLDLACKDWQFAGKKGKEYIVKYCK